jgi:hypothetical protein
MLPFTYMAMDIGPFQASSTLSKIESLFTENCDTKVISSFSYSTAV